MHDLICLSGSAAPERVAPEKVLLFRYGTTKYLRDGGDASYEFCEADADRIREDYRRGGVDLPVDYHHQSLSAAKNGNPAPAAGWIVALEKSKEGLLASVKWTDRARSYLESGEYRYTSPLFMKDKKTGHVAKLVNLALTNIPATQRCPELVAAENIPEDSGRKEHPMKDVLELLGLEGSLEGEAAEAAVKTACQAIKAKADASDSFVDGLREELALEKDVTLESLSGMILGLSERAKQGDAAKAELDALKTASDKAKRDTLIAEALEKGMPNCQKQWAESLTLEQLEGYCHTLAPGASGTVPVGKTTPTPPRAAKEKSRIFEALGLEDDEDNDKTKKGC
ncbi:MAG: phage protease [Victivallaceae bacterium]|nr:phage protease [Victivallaceae bacterium]